MAEERRIQVARNEIETVDEALGWIVKQLDTEFAGAVSIALHVEQTGHPAENPADPWQYSWTASIAGMTRTEGR